MTSTDDVNKSAMIVAPGGNLKHVTAAIEEGAGAVYAGPRMMSGRSGFAEMSMEDIEQARQMTKNAGVKLYAAINRSIPIGDEQRWEKKLAEIATIKPDALIIGSFDVMTMVQEMKLNIPLHASSFMGIYNPHGAQVVKNLGFRRIVLNTGLLDSEMEVMVTLLPDVEFELIAYGGICPNDNHRCNLPHGLRADGDGNNPDETREVAYCQSRMILTDQNNREINRGRLMCLPVIDRSPSIGCFLDMGIRHFKIAGRERSADFVRTAVRRLRNALDKAFRERSRTKQDNEDSEFLKGAQE